MSRTTFFFEFCREMKSFLVQCKFKKLYLKISLISDVSIFNDHFTAN